MYVYIYIIGCLTPISVCWTTPNSDKRFPTNHNMLGNPWGSQVCAAASLAFLCPRFARCAVLTGGRYDRAAELGS